MPITFEIPAEGEGPTPRFFSKVPFEEDKYVIAIEMKPSNTKAISEGLEPPSPQPGMHVGKKVAMRAPDEGFFERMGDDAGFSAYIMKKLRRKTR